MRLKKKSQTKFKIVILASHPIQYQAPFFKELSKEENIDLTVFFCSDFGLKEYKDEGFGKEFKWDIPLLEGFKYEFLQNISLFPSVARFLGLVNPDIIEKISKKEFNAIWIHGWANCTNWLAMLTAFFCGVPVLMRGESNLLNKQPLWKRAIKRILFAWLFKQISGFLAIGKYNKEFYKHYGVPEEKIHLVPYAINNKFFISKANELLFTKNEIRDKYEIPKDLPVVLFCGKLIKAKCPIDLLKAFEMLSKEVKSALIFVGDGTLRQSLESYANNNSINNVYFMGFKNQAELPEFYALSDVLVLPSEFEPWGLVVNEAMCFGLPVIVSDKVGAGGDLVKEGINGFVYPWGNINLLCEKLKFILKDKNPCADFKENSLDLVKSWSYLEEIIGLNNALSKL